MMRRKFRTWSSGKNSTKVAFGRRGDEMHMEIMEPMRAHGHPEAVRQSPRSYGTP